MKIGIGWIISVVLIFCMTALAEESLEPSSTGENFAVRSASKEQGIKLSTKAKEAIKIKTTALGKDFTVPDSAIIHERDEIGVYVKRGDWFRYLEVDSDNSYSSTVKIESKKLKIGDQIVVSGLALLRLAEINAWSGGEGGDDD